MIQKAKVRIPSLHVPFRGNFPVTFPFGAMPDARKLQKKFDAWDIVGHNGVDFGLPEGTNVYACGSGKIIHSGNNGDFGICVILEHQWGESWYAHLQKAKVSVGQHCRARQILGFSGASGNATGPHLHFAIKPLHTDPYNGYLGFVDPMPYLSK